MRVLVDCVGIACDDDFLQTELAFVAHVRSRQEADVHVLITAMATGGNGQEYTFRFVGQGRFAGQDRQLRQTALAAESDDDIRREMARVLGLGLVPYLLDSPAAGTLAVVPRARSRRQPPGPDPWNRWTFRSGVSGNGSAERASRFSTLSGSFGANRTTAATRFNLGVTASRTTSSYSLPGDEDYSFANSRFRANTSWAGALNDHWSIGALGSYGSTTFENLDSSWYAAPAIEFDVFPYSRSTERLFTMLYAVGVRGFDYQQETLFGRLEERTAAHLLAASLAVRQRWGSIDGGLDATSFLPDMERNRVSGWAELSFALTRGLALTVSGEARSVRDQVFLPRGQATAEQVIARQRQLPTRYQLYYSFGVSYTFGSIYSPVVNPRMLRGGF